MFTRTTNLRIVIGVTSSITSIDLCRPHNFLKSIIYLIDGENYRGQYDDFYYTIDSRLSVISITPFRPEEWLDDKTQYVFWVVKPILTVYT